MTAPIPLFFDGFLNPFNYIWFAVLCLVGIIIGILARDYIFAHKNKILYIRERDGRGIELNIDNEDAISLRTNSNPPMKFFKYGRSYEVRKRGRSAARFFGKEGTAYTWRLEGFTKEASKYKNIKVPQLLINPETNEPVIDKEGKQVFQEVTRKVPIEWKEKEINLDFPTLEEVIKYAWGNEYDEGVPEHLKELLRNNRVFVTVGLESGIVPEGYEPITESIIEEQADEEMAGLFARAAKGIVKKDTFERLAWIGTGIAVGFALQLFGVI